MVKDKRTLCKFPLFLFEAFLNGSAEPKYLAMFAADERGVEIEDTQSLQFEEQISPNTAIYSGEGEKKPVYWLANRADDLCAEYTLLGSSESYLSPDECRVAFKKELAAYERRARVVYDKKVLS